MSAFDAEHAGRYFRTVAHLRPAQIVHRVRLRAQQRLLRRWPRRFERRWRHQGGESRWPESFVAVDAVAPPDCGSIAELESGRLTFLNETRELGQGVAWDPPGASRLWLFHLHYWEWTWTLLNEPDRNRARRLFGRQFRSWAAASRFGAWNAWAPYPTSVRAWAFVNAEPCLVRGTPEERSFHEMLQLHAGFVEHNLELDVGGNHLLKNLKALLGLGVYFDDARLIGKATAHLARQLEVQILGDGGHFELSPAYHCQVLGDLIDVDALTATVGLTPVDGLVDAVAAMRRWLGVMLMPDGDVPLFNDCVRVGVGRVQVLRPEPDPATSLTVLRDSGHVVARPGERIHLVADVGRPCPPDLPAHAHADCLSFELAIDGRRVVVDPGTSVYAAGPQRQWERGTRAHSTITLDRTDQTEVWGSFRAGRLAVPALDFAGVEDGRIRITASHSGYTHLPGSPIHTRTWLVDADRIEIDDVVAGRGRHRVDLRVLLDAAGVVHHDGAEVAGSGYRIAMRHGGENSPRHARVCSRPASFAVGHGDLRDAVALEGSWVVDLPARFTTTIVLTPVVVSPTADEAAK